MAAFDRRDRLRRLTAEALGTALLIVAVVGSGIMASRAVIAPRSAPMFVVMQLIGALIASALVRFLFPSTAERSDATC